MDREHVRRWMARMVIVVAMLPATSAFAAGGVPVNIAHPSVGRADHQDKFALDVAQPVVATAGTWTGALAYSYLFWRCPTPTLGVSCTPIGGWQPDLQTLYDRSFAGQYAIVEVEASDAAGTSMPVASPAKLLTVPPTLDASAIHLSGAMADGTVAPGASLDVRVDPAAITGVPAPAVTITWARTNTSAGSDVIAENVMPYAGPLDVPVTRPGDEIGIHAEVTVTNAGGTATHQSAELGVRTPPFMTDSCFCLISRHPPAPLPVSVGDRVPSVDLELGIELGLPRITAGVPVPKVTTHWLRCRHGKCSPILRATGDSYTATRRDVGYSLRLRVTARNALGSYSLDLVTPGRLAVRAPRVTKSTKPVSSKRA